MAKDQNFWRWLIRRPKKLVTNFLKTQILLSLFAAIIVGVFFPLEPISQVMIKSDEQQKIGTNAGIGEAIFTQRELASFNGEDGQPIYLALLGSVYDVSKGVKHYGPNCAYNFFVGRDASVAFISGDFDNFDATQADDVLKHLERKDLPGLVGWKDFYDKEYVYKGKLIGRFYDEQGKLTAYHHKFLAALKHAEEVKDQADQLNILYPECNIEWSEQKGTHVWCTKSSGGKNRDWVGYPRKLFQIGKDDFRCACIRTEDLKTTAVMLKEYENCDAQSHDCYYRVD